MLVVGDFGVDEGDCFVDVVLEGWDDGGGFDVFWVGVVDVEWVELLLDVVLVVYDFVEVGDCEEVFGVQIDWGGGI